MNLQQSGFRPAYYHFCAFPLNEERKKVLAGWPGLDRADYMLTRGFIDAEAGLTLEVITLGRKNPSGYSFFNANTQSRAMFRADTLKEEEFIFFADADGSIASDYASKLLPLKTYAVSEKLEKTREIPLFDPCRHPFFPDRVRIQLRQEGEAPEEVWALIDHLEENRVAARLLSTPEHIKGFVEGNTVGFYMDRDESGRPIAVAELDPDKWLTEEELRDGSLLRAAMKAFNEKRTEENFIELMLLLRDSTVVVPCHTILSDEDKQRAEEMIKAAGNDIESLRGKTFENSASVSLIPDLLENSGRLYFPCFTSAEEMGEYGTHMAKLRRPFTDVITLARNNEQKPVAIVLDPFTESYALPADLYPVVEGCRSRIR